MARKRAGAQESEPVAAVNGVKHTRIDHREAGLFFSPSEHNVFDHPDWSSPAPRFFRCFNGCTDLISEGGGAMDVFYAFRSR